MAARALAACALAAAAPAALGAEWAVIVAGSSGYMNYRHQADACHAYQIAVAKGIPAENIILMAADDVARDEENPFPGKLFNRPDPHGPGVDVYAGCKIDYRGDEVTPSTFLKVLAGEGEGKVLKSTAEDHVFVNFVDHGAPGIIAFPSDELHKHTLQKALRSMHEAGMFSKLVFYLEACESGSMFEGMHIPGVYALSAANGEESSFGAYCDNSVVNGQDLGTCLGDLFSISWMEDSDVHDLASETLEVQFKRVKARTNLSHVLQWGDKSFVNDPVSEFFGDRSPAASMGAPAPPPFADDAVSAREVDLRRRFRAYTSGRTPEARLRAVARMEAELAQQTEAERAYQRFLDAVQPGDSAKQQQLREGRAKPNHPECELDVHAAIRVGCAGRFDANSGFALRFHQVVVNVCDAVAHGLEADPVAAAGAACGGGRTPTGPSGVELVV